MQKRQDLMESLQISTLNITLQEQVLALFSQSVRPYQKEEMLSQVVLAFIMKVRLKDGRNS